MFHMEAIEKVDEQTTEVGGVSKEEVQEGSLVVGEPAPNNAKRKSRKKRWFLGRNVLFFKKPIQSIALIPDWGWD